MRCGLTILPEHSWGHAAPMWRQAEELGFDHAWTYDHLVWGGLPDSPWYGTTPTLTAAAMVTTTIRLGTFVTSPNYRHPVTFMRDLLALDDISGGRLICGIGAGGDIDSAILGGQLLTPEAARRPALRVHRAARPAAHDRPCHPRRHLLLGGRRPHAARPGPAAEDPVRHGCQRSSLAAPRRRVRRRLGHHRPQGRDDGPVVGRSGHVVPAGSTTTWARPAGTRRPSTVT